MIGILDYGVGNVRALMNLCADNNIFAAIIKDPVHLDSCSHLILPGVGHFDQAIRSLKNSALYKPILLHVFEFNKPILGICVGMQMMATRSDEGAADGLNWIPGTVRKFCFGDRSLPVPHMGWNNLIFEKELEIFKNLGFADSEFYFLHSYFYDLESSRDLAASCEYGDLFPAVIQRDNIFGMQCHPEKSHLNGINFLRNFSEYRHVTL